MKSLSPEAEVTRLLYSNLIKSGIVSVDGREKRVIDSDSIFNAGFRPLVFERVEEIPDEAEAEEETVSEESITMESGLTPEQTDLLFHADSDEAAVQMLLAGQSGEAFGVGKVSSAGNHKKNSASEKKKKPDSAAVDRQSEQTLKEAKEEAERIINEANVQAEEIFANAQAEAQRLTENAHQEGFQQGYQEGMENAQAEIENSRQQLALEAQQLQEEYEQQIAGLEPQVVDFISDIVKKLTGVVLAERKDILAHLVSSCLEGIERSGLYLIHVSREDYHDLLEKKSELEQLVQTASELRIVEDASLGKNECLIETDTTIYDSSLDLQLERLCEDLKMLSLQE